MSSDTCTFLATMLALVVPDGLRRGIGDEVRARTLPVPRALVVDMVVVGAVVSST
ncbi:MAG: hypothetical protein KF740_00625 [Ramlibacter sp.]|nr:hypothetical protein [Ramlibacter sp.]